MALEGSRNTITSRWLQHLPVVAVDYVFIRPDLWKDATAWLTANRDQLVQARKEN
ncbi:MAG: hypothetical protein ACHRXM_09730 [Isosphaerales bacterium]